MRVDWTVYVGTQQFKTGRSLVASLELEFDSDDAKRRVMMPNDEGKLKTTACMDALCQVLVADRVRAQSSICTGQMVSCFSSRNDAQRRLRLSYQSYSIQPIKPVILASCIQDQSWQKESAYISCLAGVAEPGESTIQKHQFSTELKSGVFSPRLTTAFEFNLAPRAFLALPRVSCPPTF